jgi:hypothetical protein
MKNTPIRDGYAPHYPCSPIHGLASLSKALGVRELRLQRVASQASKLYRLAAEETKKDGTKRQTFDAFPLLKAIQIRIMERILVRVEYPTYLNGGLRGRSTRKNAAQHVGSKIAFGEDIASFFPSIGSALIKTMWGGLFGFSADVAELLTLLTTKDGGVPEGAVTSSYLANLVFWAHEPNMVRRFVQNGQVYTRFVDDMTVSSKRRLSKDEQTEIISALYGMLLKHGVKPKRSKHEVSVAGRRMMSTKLMHNKRVALAPDRRQNIRAAVFKLEGRVAFGDHDAALLHEINSVAGKVGQLNGLHVAEGKKLKARLKALRARVTTNAHAIPATTVPSEIQPSKLETPPWE